MFKSAARSKSYVTQKSIGADARRRDRSRPALALVIYAAFVIASRQDRRPEIGVDARSPTESFFFSFSFSRLLHPRLRHAYPRKWKSGIISHRIVLANASFCLRSACYLIPAGSPCTARWLAHFGEIRTTDMSTRWKSFSRERLCRGATRREKKERESERMAGKRVKQ